MFVLLSAALAALAAVIVVLAVSTGDDDVAPAARAPASGDPSAAYEAAAKKGLASVVQIRQEHGLGSGVVLDGSGDIVTNAHVVAGGKKFIVVTPDGKERAASLRGAFRQGDVAVVRVSGVELEPAQFADSSKLEVGQAVLALGSTTCRWHSPLTSPVTRCRSRSSARPATWQRPK